MGGHATAADAAASAWARFDAFLQQVNGCSGLGCAAASCHAAVLALLLPLPLLPLSLQMDAEGEAREAANRRQQGRG